MKHRSRSLFLVAALSAFCSRDLSAQTGYAAYESTITASNHAGGDMFGGSVAVVGDTAFVGAPGRAGGQGSVYVLVHSGASWTETARLDAGDGNLGHNFGNSIAVSGDTLVVGSPFADGIIPYTGAVYVYVKVGSSWVFQAKLTANDGAHGDAMGGHVSISGDTVVAGANWDDEAGGVDSGSAYVFVRSGTSWSQQAKLVPNDGIASADFGSAVGISGDTIVVGAIGDFINAFNEGSAYVFVRSGTVWTQEGKLIASDISQSDAFGRSASIDGDTLVVGAVSSGTTPSFEPGALYVFVRSGTVWSQQAKLVAIGSGSFDQLGESVALTGDTIVSGAPRNAELGGQTTGAIYTFQRSATTWTERQKVMGTAGTTAMFGESVAIAGSVLFAGADGVDLPGANDTGLAYSYTLTPAFATFCFGDNTGTHCPCGNTSPLGQGRGCVNSAHPGARLEVTGIPSIAADTVVLRGREMLNGTALYFQGNGMVNGGMGSVYGDGLVCAGGSAVRFATTTNVNGMSTFPNAAHPTPLSVAGMATAGASRTYQVWYRDNSTFCPPDTFNFSNGIKITWAP